MSQTVYSFLVHLTHWHWGVLAIGLTLVEIAVPRSFFLWWGVAAGVVSGTLFLFPSIGWQMEWLLFVSVALLTLGLSRFRRAARPTQLNRRASPHVGRLFTLTAPIQNGVGSLSIGDTRWTIRGLDMAAGTQVKVVGFEGTVLSVEALEVSATEAKK